jgi:translation initiation factor 1 (eIF-1/SUI1)
MRKGITTIYGLDLLGFNNKDMTKVASSIKKKFGCASYVKEIEGIHVIEIQGDKTVETKNILINEYNIPNNKISVL